MSKVISPIMTDGTGMAIAQAINHATAVNLALNTASYEEDGTLLEVQDARRVNETEYASLGEAIRTEVTRIDNEKAVQEEALEGHADRITAVENKANTNATNIANLNDATKILSQDQFNNALLWRGQPVAGSDLDAIQTTGFYWISNIKNMLNYPPNIGAQSGAFIVFKNVATLRLLQMFIGSNSIYTRQIADGVSFLNWYKISGEKLE